MDILIDKDDWRHLNRPGQHYHQMDDGQGVKIQEGID